MSGLRVIICGSRSFTDYETVRDAMDRIHAETPIIVVLHGAARGVDSLAEQWARERKITCYGFPARWSELGKYAGPRRNQLMLDEGAHVVIAFPGGDGTADMVRRARKAGVRVIEPCSEGDRHG